MQYWEIKKLNGYASLGIGEKQINKVGEIINGTNPPNEKEKRIKFVNKANEILK